MLYGTNHAFNCAEMRLDAGCILQYIDHLMYSLINRLETSTLGSVSFPSCIGQWFLCQNNWSVHLYIEVDEHCIEPLLGQYTSLLHHILWNILC